METATVMYILPNDLGREIRHNVPVSSSRSYIQVGDMVLVRGGNYKVTHVAYRGYGNEIIVYLDYKNAQKRTSENIAIWDEIINKTP